MNTMTKKHAKVTVGCVTVLLSLGVALPIWFILLYHLLVKAEAESWAWSVYWIYVPSRLVAGLLAKALEAWNKP